MKYLWVHRERPRIGSRRWWVVWAKRTLMLCRLVHLALIQARLRAKGMQIGELSVVYRFRIEGSPARISIGSHSFVAQDVTMAAHDGIIVGSRVVINDGVRILTASHGLGDSQWRTYSREIRIDDYAWIATNATILPGVHVGEGAVVGAGAVVRSDVAPYTIVVGNPAVALARKRVRELAYDPVLFSAPFEAWVGANNATKLEH
ncbi:maltose O-acetyltransferase [Paraburkholderia bannensis]|uniref:Maltose O-acetyltransferase n=1 Tax=Paraburkholderia bannensis TaxID=765414 RepID=A0A7W9TV04_9BURK|nr:MULTISPECIES: acyltransferase [Paraburkholderia]MBB3255238.1 maltose O-acetyltransferase [Paraburkholderia sp. WP4_3_2]MBB6100750.1 maltose O-acetyltransferase [Paraburkholderia bannensis]